VAEAILVFEVFEQVCEDVGPGAVLTPAPEAAVDSLPRALTLGDVPPGGAGVHTPQDAIEDTMVILPGSSAAVVVCRVGKERCDALPPLLR
jgi:hypothetical protein